MTERAGRRSDKVAPFISSFVVSFHSPLVRPHNRQNRLGIYAEYRGYIDGDKHPSFYPSFGGTRRHFCRHYCRQSGVKKGYFYPYIPPIYSIYTPLKSRAGFARSSCHSATLAQAAPRGLAALALLASERLGMRAFGAPAMRRLPPPLRGTPDGVRCPDRSA